MRKQIALVAVSIAVVTVTAFVTSVPLHPQASRSRSVNVQDLFYATGWMGDGESGRQYVQLSPSKQNPHSAPDCLRIIYKFGPTRWAGVYWQNRPDNWGEHPGEDYSDRRLTRVVFWARGADGDEVVEFKAGGIDTQRRSYRDSFSASAGRVTLSREWKKYEIDLAGKDLRSVIGGFCWVASADFNAGKQIEFYLDDITLE